MHEVPMAASPGVDLCFEQHCGIPLRTNSSYVTRPASSAELTTRPLGIGTPKRLSSSLAWNSWRFIVPDAALRCTLLLLGADLDAALLRLSGLGLLRSSNALARLLSCADFDPTLGCRCSGLGLWLGQALRLGSSVLLLALGGGVSACCRGVGGCRGCRSNAWGIQAQLFGLRCRLGLLARRSTTENQDQCQERKESHGLP
jgi:hypothetical protein